MRMRFAGWVLMMVSIGAAGSAPAAGQTAAVPAQTSLPVVARAQLVELDRTALRDALAGELGVPIEIASEPPPGQAYLVIEGSQIERLRVAFVRVDGSSVERSLDLSSMRGQASEALALLAANLTRDEAAELLASLPRQPPPAADPASQPTAAAPAADSEQPPPPPKKRLPSGCDPRPELERRSFGFDVVPYVGTTGREPTRVERALSFNLIGGLTGAVRGVEISPFFNLDVEGTCGLQLSGMINIDAGSTEGVQMGEINWTGGRLDGVQLGMVSIVKDDVLGAQLGLVNLGAGELTGAQLGLVNFAATGMYGAQLGLVNVAAGPVTGAQLGLVNTARLRLDAVQAGLANLSAGDSKGAQLGLVNVSTGAVNGAMIGLVNVAREADAAIGLVNVMWNGTTNLDVWGTDAGLGVIGLRHGGRYTHNFYGVGFTGRDGRLVLAWALGFGVTVYRGGPIFIELDALHYSLVTRLGSQANDAGSRYRYGSIAQLRLPIGWQIARGLALFVSPAVNVSVAEREDNPLADPSLIGSTLLTHDTAKLAARIWPGFTLGLRFF